MSLLRPPRRSRLAQGASLLALGLLLGVVGWPGAVPTVAVPTADAPLRFVASRACKPAGPWGARLQPIEAKAGGLLTVDVVLAPRLPHAGLSWELDVPAGTQLLQGALRGEVQLEVGEERRERVVLRLPPASTGVTLEVLESDPRGLRSSHELGWGVAESVGRSQLLQTSHGAQLAEVVLPTLSTAGR